MKLLAHISLFFSSALLFSCAGDREVQTVELESLIPQSERPIYVMDTIKNEVSEVDSFSLAWLEVIPDLEIIEMEEPLQFFPDRFNVQKRDQLFVVIEDQTFTLTSWEFNDSLQLMSAFYNWLDCFGSSCGSLKVNENNSVDRNQTLAVWVGGNKMVYLASKERINQRFWQEHMNKLYDHNWNFHFIQQKQRKVEWFVPEQAD